MTGATTPEEVRKLVVKYKAILKSELANNIKESKDDIRSTGVLERRIKRLEAEWELDAEWVDREAQVRLNEIEKARLIV